MKNLIVYSFLLLLYHQATAQDTLSIFDFLSREEMLKLTIETDMNQLVKKKHKEIYQAAILSFEDVQGDSLNRQSLKIRTRGNARKSLCYYPPLKLKFPKQQLGQLGLNPTFNKLKLVCQCKSGATNAQYVFCLLYTSPSPRDLSTSRMPSSA